MQLYPSLLFFRGVCVKNQVDLNLTIGDRASARHLLTDKYLLVEESAKGTATSETYQNLTQDLAETHHRLESGLSPC